MQRTKESVKLKWAKKVEQMKVKAHYKYEVLKQNKKKSWYKRTEYELEKLDRKRDIYIRKMEEKYHRGMMNEIREIENRPPRVYK
jgi:hypothetical protein